MKNSTTTSVFVLLAVVAGLIATTSPAAFADHPEVTVEAAMGSGVPGCETTEEGCYIPNTAVVDVGGVVIFSNPDTVAHTFTSGTPADGADGIFDSSIVMSGSAYEWSPDTVGEYPYFCIVHPWMVGTIIVQEVGGEKEPMQTHEKEQKQTHEKEQIMDQKRIGSPTATGMLSDGTTVKIWASEPTAGEMMEISIKFADSEHVNHDIMVTQNGEEVLNDQGAHHHDGKGIHTTAPLSSSDPVDITITFQGYGVNDPKTGPVGEVVSFTNVVPEFGTIAMMVLAVAIISIVAVTAKSRVVPRF